MENYINVIVHLPINCCMLLLILYVENNDYNYVDAWSVQLQGQRTPTQTSYAVSDLDDGDSPSYQHADDTVDDRNREYQDYSCNNLPSVNTSSLKPGDTPLVQSQSSARSSTVFTESTKSL